MRLASFVSGFVFLVTLFTSTFAEETVVTEPEPELKVTGSFPSDNPFGHVVNGERNIINLFIENNTKQKVSLLSIAGSFHHPETDRLLKNMTATKFGVKLQEGDKLPVQYPFYSQCPGDIKLKIWLEIADETQYRVSAYDSIVTVVEPELSLLDWKLWTTYLIVFGILGGGTYFTFLSFFPKSKKPKVAVPSGVSAPVVAATSSGGYEEEWIPEHHLKKTKKGGAATSDAETSGGEVSGKEGPRRRKGRK
ncbi:hypothetical protein BDM02DRAFT_3155514 [Thelephora ganbajun]|uniref:Uncharacterized protein n=1 Tax=Thelephora ganbajun TaxID=370292 RepID=A0ACB6ZHJ7_THEGA|nr:hypothetical protein BDM02DRAFT_3155514 [Thelephora ganbajun]